MYTHQVYAAKFATARLPSVPLNFKTTDDAVGLHIAALRKRIDLSIWSVVRLSDGEIIAQSHGMGAGAVMDQQGC